MSQITDFGYGDASRASGEDGADPSGVTDFGYGGRPGSPSPSVSGGGPTAMDDDADSAGGSLGFGAGPGVSGLSGAAEDSGDSGDGGAFGQDSFDEGYRGRVRAIRDKRAAAARPPGALKSARFENLMPGVERVGAAEALPEDFNCFRFRRDDRGRVSVVPNCMPSVVGDRVKCVLPNWWQAQRAHEAFVQKINKCRVTVPRRGPGGELVLEPVKNPDGTYAKWSEDSGECYSADVGRREAAYRRNAGAGRPTFVENGTAMHATPGVLCRAHMQRFHPDEFTFDRARAFAEAIETDHANLEASGAGVSYAAPLFRWAEDAELPEVVDGDASDRALTLSRAHQRGDVDPVAGVSEATVRRAGMDMSKSAFSRDEAFLAATGAKSMADLRRYTATFSEISDRRVPMQVTRVTGRRSTQAERFNEHIRKPDVDLDGVTHTRVLRSARRHGVARAAAAAAALGGAGA